MSLNKPRNRPTNGFSEPSRGLTARPQNIGNLSGRVKVEPGTVSKTHKIFAKLAIENYAKDGHLLVTNSPPQQGGGFYKNSVPIYVLFHI